MAKEYIRLDNLKVPGFPNWAIKDTDKGLVFVAGMIGIDLDTLQLADGLGAQCELALKNTKFLLEKAGAKLEDCTQVTLLFVEEEGAGRTPPEDFGVFIKAKQKVAPEMEAVGVASRTPALVMDGALFEIMVIATLP